MQTHNMIQPETTVQNPQNVQEVSRRFDVDFATSSQKTMRKRDKGHVDYWKQRLFRNTYDRNGETVECSRFAVKIQHRGERETFALKASNREAAAREAKDIYNFVLANGMAAAVRQFKPEMAARVESPTIAEFLAEIKTKAGFRPKTFKSYTFALRKIASDVFKIDGGKEKFDYRSGGNAEWLKRVEATKLDALTPDKVQSWKVAFLAKAGSNPVELARAKRNVNSIIRQAKSLFSRKATRFLTDLNLETPGPFDGIAFEKAGSMRYKSTIDYRTLVVAARNELAEAHPEQYKILLLALGAGLRKGEIDTLTWRQIDWQNATIWIGATEHFTPKTEDSQGTVDVDSDLLDELRRHMPQSQGEFVINSRLRPRPDAACQYYRCDAQFVALNGWLRSKGITAQKPLHELRKEFGSLVCEQAGIFAASTQLRHGDIRVTASFYLDKKQRVTVKLGDLLSQAAVQAVPPASEMSA